MLGILFTIVAAIVVAAVAAFGTWRAVGHVRTRRLLRLTGPNAIAEGGFVRIGGIEQWIGIRGEDRANPVLLVVHGGPGSSFQVFSHRALRPWERRYTVVHWDQRGAGRTFGRNGAAGCGPLTLDRMAQDGLEVVSHVLARTGHDKVILLGASWGSILGLEMVRRAPELFSAYVGAGQVVDMVANEAVGYDGLVARLEARGKAAALQKLEAIGPPPYADLRVLIKQRRILMGHPPQTEQGLTPRLLLNALQAPDVRLLDLRDWFGGAAYSSRQLWDILTSYADAEPLRPVAVPVVIIQGEEDIQTPTSLARAYFERLDAPVKHYVEIPGGGHMALIAMPGEFLEALETQVRPLAARQA